MKNKFLLVTKLLLAVIILTLINCGLLVFAFTLPTGRMRKHVAESYPLIEAEHPYLQWDQGYTNSMMDFWSEYNEYGMAINEDSEGYVLIAMIPFVIIVVLGNGYAFVHAFMAH
ncbi:MAG: hypothetical protein K6A90_07970 [Lachnospiraceae bacterium]|nr:hypothetical protein [Lachnospiraceae bacterium]